MILNYMHWTIIHSRFPGTHTYYFRASFIQNSHSWLSIHWSYRNECIGLNLGSKFRLVVLAELIQFNLHFNMHFEEIISVYGFNNQTLLIFDRSKTYTPIGKSFFMKTQMMLFEIKSFVLGPSLMRLKKPNG